MHVCVCMHVCVHVCVHMHVCVHACVYLLSQPMGAGAKTLVAHCRLSQGVVHWFSGSPGNHLCKYPAHKTSRQDLNKQLDLQLFWLTAMMCECVLCGYVCVFVLYVLCVYVCVFVLYVLCVCVLCVCVRACVCNARTCMSL